MTPTVPRPMCVGCGYTASQLGRDRLLSFYTLVGRAGLWSVTVTKQQGQGKHLCGGFQVTESGVLRLGEPPTQGFLQPLDHSLDKQPLVTPSLSSSAVRSWGDLRSRAPPKPAAWHLLAGFAENVLWAYYRKCQLLKDICVRELILSSFKPSPLQSYFRD